MQFRFNLLHVLLSHFLFQFSTSSTYQPIQSPLWFFAKLEKSKELNGINVTDAPQIRGRWVRLRWSARAALAHVPRQAYARAGDQGQGVGLRS